MIDTVKLENNRLLKIFSDKIYYKIVFLVFALLRNVAFFTGPITTISLYLMTFWALGIFAYDFFIAKRLFAFKYSGLLFAFLVAYAITVLVNFDLNLLDNVKNFIYTLIQFFILCWIDLNADKEKVKKEMLKLNYVIIACIFFLSLCSLIVYIFSIPIEINGSHYGFTNSMLFGVYTNPSPGGISSFISVVLFIVNLVLYKIQNVKITKGVKGYFIANLVVQFLYVSLCNTRGSELAWAAFIGAACVLLLKNKFRTMNKFSKAPLVFALVVAIVLSGSFFVATTVTRKVMSYVPSTVQYIEFKLFPPDEDELLENGVYEQPVIESLDNVKNLDYGFFSGRNIIWGSGLKVAKDNLVFGIGVRNIYDHTKMYLPYKHYTDANGAGMHNGYLQVLLSNGIVGLALFLAILLSYGKHFVKYLFAQHALSNRYVITSVISAFIAAMLFNNLVETRILLNNALAPSIFWTYVAYGIYLLKDFIANGDKIEIKA